MWTRGLSCTTTETPALCVQSHHANIPQPNPPSFNPDPTICRVGDDYFLATSTFEYFPGVPVYHSRDLINWKIIGHVLNRKSKLELRTCEPGGRIYAPTLRYDAARGRWYMTTAALFRQSMRNEHDSPTHPRGFYVWTDDIWDETRWSDPVWLDMLGIDQDLFFDDDGKVYNAWATGDPSLTLPDGKVNLKIWIMEIDLESGDALRPPALIRAQHEVGNWVAEGPHVFKKDGWYYLPTAEGGTQTEHQVWISRAKHPFGPWETPPSPINPLVYNADDAHVQQTGHMDMVQGPDGRWWAVLLAVRNRDGRLSQLGLETFLCPVVWDDGWPVVNSRKPVSVVGAPGCGLPQAPATEGWTDGFSPETNLSLEGWYFLRTPQKPFHSLTRNPAALSLRGGPYGFNEDEAVSMVAKKQTAFDGEWKIDFSFLPDAPEQVAGAAVWWSKWCNGAVVIRGTDQGEGKVGSQLEFRLPDGNGFKETNFPAPADNRVQLVITATREGYAFTHDDTRLGFLPDSLLVQDRGYDAMLTGMFLALQAYGAHGFGCRSDAVFRSVEWKGILDEAEV